MTYLQILNTIKDTALAQPNVNSVVREFLDLNREDAKYSAVVIQDRDGSRDRIVEQDYVTYTWHLGYVDRLTYDESNRDDIISTGINIINNIVNTIRNTWFPELEVSIVDRINTFDQRFTAQCAGVYVVLAVNAQVSDCIDSESTDLYDTYDAKITANGVYHFVPSGRPVDEINITVDVEGKEEVSLTDTVTMNGIHTYIPEENTVYKDVELTVDVHPSERLVETITSNGTTDLSGEWKDASITVDVHPSSSLSETYTTNGVKTITGEFNGGTVNVDVHPSNKLVETITSNGTKSFSGEWKDAAITVAIPSDQKPEESLEKTITSNGSFHYDPSAGSVFSGADITVNCPVPKTEERGNLTISSNSSGVLIPSSGNVFDGVDYIVDVHPSDKLVKTITSNGTTDFSGEWKDASITVDVHPSQSLVETITSNGSYNYPGEYSGVEITVAVSAAKPEESLVETISSNGSYHYDPTPGSVFSSADITVAIQTTTTVTMTQAQYDALTVKDPNTIYLING